MSSYWSGELLEQWLGGILMGQNRIERSASFNSENHTLCVNVTLNEIVDHQRTMATSRLKNALAAIKSFNAAGLEQILRRASTELSRPTFLRQTVAPLIEQIGIYWQSGQIEAIQEHLATAVIRTFLGNLLHTKALGKNAPRIVFTTPPAELHELGALLAAVTADYQGWGAIYLGPSLPADAIAAAVRLSGARRSA